MFCQFPLPVFFNHSPDFFHSFNNEHLCISQFILLAIIIFTQKRIIFCIKSINCIQKDRKMIIDNCSPLEILKLQKNLSKIADGEGIEFVSGKGKRKSEIQQLFMFCQFPLPVFFNHSPDFIHSFNNEHLCISQFILLASDR